MSDIDWLSAVNGDFNTAADWAGGVVPGAGDTAVLGGLGSPYAVTISTGETYSDLTIAKGVTVGITGANGQALSLDNGLSENDGTLKIGEIHGGAGASYVNHTNDTTNRGTIIVNAGGLFQATLGNVGIFEVAGGEGRIIGGHIAGGRIRVDGGVLQTAQYSGPLTFFGSGGGTWEFGVVFPLLRGGHMETVSGFSKTGATSLEIAGADQPGFETFGITGTRSYASHTVVTFSGFLGNNSAAFNIRFNGNYLGESFTAADVDGNLVVTCHVNAAAAKPEAVAALPHALPVALPDPSASLSAHDPFAQAASPIFAASAEQGWLAGHG